MKKLLLALMIVFAALAAMVIPSSICFSYLIGVFGDKQHALIFLLCYDLILSIIFWSTGIILEPVDTNLSILQQMQIV